MDSDLNRHIPYLVKYLSAKLPKLSQNWWSKLVVGNLTEMQRRWVSQNDKTKLSELDLAALLTVLEKNWYAITRKENIPNEGIIYIREMKTIRNRRAHMDATGISGDDQYRDADTQFRFASLINSDRDQLEALDARRKNLMLGSQAKEEIVELPPKSKEKHKTEKAKIKKPKKEDYLRMRRAHLPENVNIVFVLESPPVSGKYFYDGSGKVSEPLFKAMMTLIGIDPVDKTSGLHEFQKSGWVLVDATYEPVNELKGKARDTAILKNYDSLVEDLRSLGDPKILDFILVKANVCKLLNEKLEKSGFNVLNKGVVIPFPSTGQQTNFYREIEKVLPESADSSPPEYMVGDDDSNNGVGLINEAKVQKSEGLFAVIHRWFSQR